MQQATATEAKKGTDGNEADVCRICCRPITIERDGKSDFQGDTCKQEIMGGGLGRSYRGAGPTCVKYFPWDSSTTFLLQAKARVFCRGECEKDGNGCKPKPK